MAWKIGVLIRSPRNFYSQELELLQELNGSLQHRPNYVSGKFDCRCSGKQAKRADKTGQCLKHAL